VSIVVKTIVGTIRKIGLDISRVDMRMSTRGQLV